MTEIKVNFDGEDYAGLLDDHTGCLRLQVAGHTINVERTDVRAAMTAQSTYLGDNGMWWDGYTEALKDLGRAIESGKPIDEWAASVKAKFGLET